VCCPTTPGGLTSTTSAHTLAYGDLGWNTIPAFINSPQFFSLAISKSNLLLAITCVRYSLCRLAAFLHSSTCSLSNGRDHVADIPIETLLLFF